MWSGRQPKQIIVSLLDVIRRILNVEFVYARLTRPDSTPIVVTRYSQVGISRSHQQVLGRTIKRWMAGNLHARSSVTMSRNERDRFRVTAFRLGLKDDLGEVVAGSHREGFPNEVERLLLAAATNQAAVALQQSVLFAEQHRMKKEFDRNVATAATVSLKKWRRSYGSLTRREREVLPFVVAGLRSKVAAAELGTSEVTIRVHRKHILSKMQAPSLATLIRMADSLNIARYPVRQRSGAGGG